MAVFRASIDDLLGFFIPRSHDRGYFLPALRACVIAAAMLSAIGVFAEQQVTDKPTANEKNTSDFDLELKKRELEGQHDAAKESLAAVMQQAAAGDLTREEQTRLEGEAAKLRPQIKSLSEQLELVNQRLTAPPAERKYPGPELKIFTLKNARAVEAQRIISQLFRPDQVSAAADERSNSVAAWLWPGYLTAIEELLARLEAAAPPGGSPAARGTAPSESVPPLPQSRAAASELGGQPQLADPQDAKLPGGSVAAPRGPLEKTGPDEMQIKIFTLRNEKASDAARIINQLFSREVQSVAADERTNSVIVRGSPGDLNIIYHIITRLDESDESKTAPQKSPVTDREASTATIPIGDLKARYEAREESAAALASQIRDIESGRKGDKKDLEKLKGQLRHAVSEAFVARQQLLRAEAGNLQTRLRQINSNLEARQRLSDQIIDHRVSDLLNPELQWRGVLLTPRGPIAHRRVRHHPPRRLHWPGVLPSTSRKSPTEPTGDRRQNKC